MNTVEDAIKQAGIYKTEQGLGLHFSPIPNWYSVTGFDCPICGNGVSWEWEGPMPGITTALSIHRSGVEPQIKGATLVNWFHRFIKVVCNQCKTTMHAENFDNPPASEADLKEAADE